MARANTKGVAVCKGAGAFLRVGDEKRGQLKGAILMFQVALHNAAGLAVLREERGENLVLVLRRTGKRHHQ